MDQKTKKPQPFTDGSTQSVERAKAIVDVLMDEYKILKSEVSETSDAGNKSISYIQMYGIFLILLIGAYFGGIRLFLEPQLQKAIPSSFWFFSIACATIFLYVLYSHISQVSFKFKVLRFRLSHIEFEINKLLKSKHLSYESHISQVLFSRMTIDNRVISPYAWIQFLSGVLFLSASIIILTLSSQVFHGSSKDYLIFLFGTISYFSTLMIFDNIRLNKFIDIERTLRNDKIASSNRNVIITYAINYFVFMALFYILFAKYLDSESFSIAIKKIDEFFSAMSELSRAEAFLSMFIYSGLCGAALPTPSELPLGAAPNFGLLFVIIACSAGKSVGATVLYFLTTFWLSRNKSIDLKINSGNGQGFIQSLNAVMPVNLSYIVCQAIPFAPMRSATIVFAAIAPKSPLTIVVVALGSAVGTVSRMLIIWWIMGFAAWLQATELGLS